MTTGEPTSVPAIVLTVLGAVIVFLGLFAAGSIAFASVGLAAIFGAGLLELLGRSVSRPNQDQESAKEHT